MEEVAIKKVISLCEKTKVHLKNVGSTVQLPPIRSAGNFLYSGTHIGAHITTKGIFGVRQLHLHLEPGYRGDM
ncbi:hypothetical protein E2C01_090957 [Portunus trituberculatus]|uniref:Uncharacterized protein n=1 Tax=Portunus trituberculatus TaxID=210409 RepID=A0A5B7JCQ7_PORTR|nr:hypothetical protein [Portunus trituberculatus]